MDKIVISYKLEWNAKSNSGTIRLTLFDFSDKMQPFALKFSDPAEFAAVHQVLRTEESLWFNTTTHVLRTVSEERAGEDEGGA